MHDVRGVLRLSDGSGRGRKVKATEKPSLEETLRRVVEKIRREYDPERIILFGSHAYGEPDEDSDIDLFIVKETEKDTIQRFVEVSRATYERGLKVIVSPLIYTPDEVRQRLEMGDDFVREVLSKGQVLYARE